MKKYSIILVDKVKGDTEKVCTLRTDNMQDLRKKLIELQRCYCEDEKPEYCETIVRDKTGKLFICMVAESDCDFVHIVPLKELENERNNVKTNRIPD